MPRHTLSPYRQELVAAFRARSKGRPLYSIEFAGEEIETRPYLSEVCFASLARELGLEPIPGLDALEVA